MAINLNGDNMKMKIKTLLVAAMLLSSCATSQKINRVSVGMDETEVVKIMGTPVSKSAIGGIVYMNYSLYETSEAAQFGRGTPYFIRIINGKVEAFGRKGDFDSTKDPTLNLNINKK